MRSLSNALRLLQLFSLEQTTLTLTYISETLQVSKSAACRLVQTLESEGFVAQDTKENVYRVGASIMSISNTILAQFAPFKSLTPYLYELAEMTGQSVQLAILEGKHILYVQKRQLVFDDDIRPQIGMRNPADKTAAGKMLLTTLSHKDLTLLYEDAPLSPSLQQSLTKCRADHYAVCKDEYIKDMAAIAILIEGTAQRPLAALSIVSTTKQMRQYEQKWLQALRKTQLKIKELER